MDHGLGKRGIVVLIACTIALASAIGVAGTAQADTETETIQPGMFLALFYEMDEGVTLDFNVTSSVPIYVYFLDKTNYDSYSALGTIPQALFRTLSPVTNAESSVEAPATGRYYLIMENTASSETASVTIDYSFGGTGLSLAGLLIVLVIVAAIGLVVVLIVVRKRKAGQQGQQPGQQYPPVMPPPQP